MSGNLGHSYQTMFVDNLSFLTFRSSISFQYISHQKHNVKVQKLGNFPFKEPDRKVDFSAYFEETDLFLVCLVGEAR